MIANGTVGDWRLSDVEFVKSFRLPSSADKREILAKKNPVFRDELLTFEEESHTYTFEGRIVPRSVTKIVHQFSGEFDPDAATAVMRQSDNWQWKQFRYLRDDASVMDDGQIIELWKMNGEVARSRGTLMHWHIEQFLNGCHIEEPQSPEFSQFLLLYDTLERPVFVSFLAECNGCAGIRTLLAYVISYPEIR